MTAKSKKKVAKKAGSVRHEIVVRVDQQAIVPTTTDLAEPIRGDGQKLSIVKTWLTEKQITRLVEQTPRKYVYQRPAKGGGKWDYVTIGYVQRVLDYSFGFNWDFEIVQHGKEQDHVWVLGKLIVKSPDGTKTITKQQFGRSEVKHKSGTKENLDYGNDLKSAASDALKKCASMIGIARDIYSKTDYKAESGNEPKDPGHQVIEEPSDEIQEGQVIGPDGKPTWMCSEGDEPISDEEYKYSTRMFGKPLCRDHQKGKKTKK